MPQVPEPLHYAPPHRLNPGQRPHDPVAFWGRALIVAVWAFAALLTLLVLFYND